MRSRLNILTFISSLRGHFVRQPLLGAPAHPIADQVDGSVGSGEGAGPDCPNVLHPRSDMQRCIYSGRPSITHQTDGIIQEKRGISYPD